MQFHNFKIILLIIACFFHFSCSTSKSTGKTEAEVLYKEALDLSNKERYLLAIEKINAIKSQYPYSFYSTHAELLHADILFMQENYIEAAAAYILFRDLHPKHEKLVHVIWRIAESYYYQLPSTFDRDLSPAFEALKYYREVIEKFSSTEYVQMSNEKIKSIDKMLLEKDLYIADFYFRTEVYDSAKYRYLDILNKYNDNNVKDLAMLRIVESAYYLKEFMECEKYSNDYLSKISNTQQEKLQDIDQKCKKNNSNIKNNI